MKKWYLVEIVNNGDAFETELKAETEAGALTEARRIVSYLTEAEKRREQACIIFSDLEQAFNNGESYFDIAEKTIELELL